MSNKRKEWRPRGPRERVTENRESSSQQSNRTPHGPVNNQQNDNEQFRSTGAKRPRSSNEDTRPSQRPHHQSQRQQPRQIQQHRSQYHYQPQQQNPRPNPHYATHQSRQHQQQHQAQARTQQHQHQRHRERINQVAPVIRAVVVTAPAPAASSAPQDPVVRDIPGFYYDLEKKKYFKITANHTLGGQFAFSQQSIKEKTTQKVQIDLGACVSIETCELRINSNCTFPSLANTRTYQETPKHSIPYIDVTIWPLGLVSSGSAAWVSGKPS